MITAPIFDRALAAFRSVEIEVGDGYFVPQIMISENLVTAWLRSLERHGLTIVEDQDKPNS